MAPEAEGGGTETPASKESLLQRQGDRVQVGPWTSRACCGHLIPCVVRATSVPGGLGVQSGSEPRVGERWSFEGRRGRVRARAPALHLSPAALTCEGTLVRSPCHGTGGDTHPVLIKCGRRAVCDSVVELSYVTRSTCCDSGTPWAGTQASGHADTPTDGGLGRAEAGA